MTDDRPKKSTTVRFGTASAGRVLRPTFRTLERFAPAAGSRLALRLWVTVPAGRRDRPAGPRLAGYRFDVPAGGSRIVAETWGTGPTVYLVHGWGGRRRQLDAFVGPLVAAGHRVVSYDAPGHGDSEPGRLGRGRSTPAELADALAAVVAVGGPAHGIVAHSLGASSSTLAVLDGLAADRLVLIAPIADPPAYTSEFARAMGFGDRVHGGLRARLERMVGRPLADFDLPARLAAAAAPPAALPAALVVHDRADKESRYADGAALADAWPGAELVGTDGLGHRRILRDADVVRRAVAFLTTPARHPART